MLHKVLDGREVLLFGKNPSELQIACYDLSLGGVNIAAYVHHEIGEEPVPDFDVKDFKDYAFKSDAYYIVVADKENYAQIREVLIANGYEPLKDFVQFKPMAYTKSRDDLALEI